MNIPNDNNDNFLDYVLNLTRMEEIAAPNETIRLRLTIYGTNPNISNSLIISSLNQKTLWGYKNTYLNYFLYNM